MSSPIAARMAAFAKAPAEGIEKEAIGLGGVFNAFRRGGASLFGMGGRAAGGIPRPPMPRPPMSPPGGGGMGLGRKLGLGAGAVGVGAPAAVAGYGHLEDNAANSPEATLNPLTWRNMVGKQHPTREAIFQRNNAEFSGMADDLTKQMAAAQAKGDTAELERLQQQMDTGDFGGGERGGDWWDPTSWNSPMKWRMGGLNPFAQQKARYYQQNALTQQRALQGEYNTELSKGGPQAGDAQRLEGIRNRMATGDMLPAQQVALQKQIAALEARMKQAPGTETDAARAIKARMQGAGMRMAPGMPQEPQGTGGGNYYPVGRAQTRPQPGRAGVSQHQYQRDPFITPYDETMQSYGNIRGQG